jgi:hypothetical protein
MSQSNLDALLLGFRNDINSGNIDDAKNKYKSITKIYDSEDEDGKDLDEEFELALRYRAVDPTSIGAGETETADDYLRSFLRAGAARTRFELLGAVLLTEYEDLRNTGELSDLVSQLNSTIGELVDVEDKINRTKKDTKSILENAGVPAKVQILEASSDKVDVRKGDTIKVDVSVENVGDQSATGVSIKIEASDGISNVPGPDTVGQLLGGQTYSETYEFTVAGSGNESETVNLSLESDNAGFDTSEVILPVDTSGAPDIPSDFPGSDELFDLIDKDGDGEITPAEMSQAVGEFLQNGTVEGNNVSPGDMSQVVGWFLSQ